MLKQINKEINDFETKSIQIVPGLFFNQKSTIEQNYFYFNSKFRTGDVDDEGNRKYFYNINRNPCKIFSKAIDFDTKNIRILTTGGGDPNKTWFMERDLKYWMREKQFGKTLNRLFKELPIFGSVVIKIIDGTPYFVDLRNFVVEQSADTLDDSNYIIEVHNYTPASFKKVANEMGWDKDKVNEAINKFYEMRGVSHLRVYERYGEIKDGNSYKHRRIYIADVGVDEYDQRNNLTAEHPGIVLSEVDFEGHPYWEFHADKIPGRWLGIGVVESLFEPQIKHNEIANLQSKSAAWKALMVFQTRDQSFNRNLSTDIKNGEVLNVDSEVTQIDMSDRNLAFFNEETQKWLKNRDELTFSYDVVQGERLPAGTPLGSAQIAMTQTLSYFEQIQEDIAIDVKEMLFRVIIPRFLSESSKEHKLRLIGQDLDIYIKMVQNELVAKEVIRLMVNGRFVSNKEREAIEIAIEESIKQNKEKILDIPKDFYKNIKYDVDIDITGESVDTRVRYATKFALLQAITSDPTMMIDPAKKKILYSMAEDGGVNPADLFSETQKIEEKIAMMMGGRAGGGVSSPAIKQSLAGTTGKTI